MRPLEGSRRGIAAIGLVLAAAGAPAFAGNAQSSHSVRAVRDVLRQRGDDDGRAVGEIVRELAALGPDAVPVLLELVRGEDFESEDAPTERWLVPVDDFPELALAALAKLPYRNVKLHVERALDDGAELDARIAAVRVLGALASAEGLELYFALLADVDPVAFRSPAIRRAFERTFAAIVERDPEAWKELRRRHSELEVEDLLWMTDTLSSVERPQSLEFLPLCLGRDARLDARILDVLSTVVNRFPWEVRFNPRPHVRRGLDGADWAVRRSACIAAARMHDHEAFPALVARLDDENAAVRRAARWALESMSRVDLGDDPQAWTRWHAAEQEFFEGEFASYVARLTASAGPTDASDALRALSRHALFRHPAAEAIGAALPRLAPELAVPACRVLAGLDSRVAVPALVDALEDPHVGDAAWQTLRELTGEDLPARANAWSAYVAP